MKTVFVVVKSVRKVVIELGLVVRKGRRSAIRRRQVVMADMMNVRKVYSCIARYAGLWAEVVFVSSLSRVSDRFEIPVIMTRS